ncbi:snaclec alboaggregin-A subunit beta'-like isoform X2 [Leucoraja erinacea]|uniref:snaclec alboaggregin-A subunit beta'-like isoform X2 n=1 Tax=Leucoraja erinaceus TaxID=7782 RepID=UPI0024573F20|nr:snaclec alboaggregin-A subunit beta'-like isoform X2 [Leucoraja erinacea]
MMLVWVLVLTALLASDVAETNSLGLEETQHHLEKRELVKGPCDEDWFYFPSLKSCHRFFSVKKTWSDAEVMCNAQPHYANLVTVNSKEHDTFIVKVIGTVSDEKTPAWIGLNDLCKVNEVGMMKYAAKDMVLFVPTFCAIKRRLQNDPLILSSSGSSALISL